MNTDITAFPACCAYCPYFRLPASRCAHHLSQSLRYEFVANPEAECPVFTEWRAAEMRQLVAQLSELT